MSGATVLAGEHRAGAPETGENLIEDQQRLVAVGEAAQPPQYGGVVKPHAARTLHQRFNYNAGDLAGMPLHQAGELCHLGIVAREIGEQMPRQQGAEGGMHAVYGI